MNRDEFMELVYETFADEPDNVLANGIIEAEDAYVEHEKAQLSMGGTTTDLQSTCNDAISRKAVKDLLIYNWDECCSACIGEVEEMPPAQPEQRWIPCSGTVDIPDHEVMACDRYGEFIIGYVDCKDKQWICESDSSLMYDPVAWCELPKPYKEGGADG